MLPLSSSGHLVLMPALLGWPYARLPADTRKAFEVALHGGAGLALAWLLRDDIRAALRAPASTAALAAPAALTGAAFERAIQTRASSPRTTAAAMVVAGAALSTANGGVACPLTPAKGGRPLVRMGEIVAVGVAQAVALVPGVSRNGATITAARLLGADRETAARISWRAGLPVIAGATVLKGYRLARRGLAPELRAPFAAGAAAALVSTLASAPLLRIRDHRLAGVYRMVLGALALRRQWSGQQLRGGSVRHVHHRAHRLEWPRG